MLAPGRHPVLHNGRCGEGEGEEFLADEVLRSNCIRTVRNRCSYDTLITQAGTKALLPPTASRP
jgi:hypothetical protein